jgi:2-keto-4-pentenoate hydratase
MVLCVCVRAPALSLSVSLSLSLCLALCIALSLCLCLSLSQDLMSCSTEEAIEELSATMGGSEVIDIMLERLDPHVKKIADLASKGNAMVEAARD